MSTPAGSLINHLPAIFRTADASGQLRSVLSAFERVLLAPSGQGADRHSPQSIEGEIAGVASLFDALATPTKFLPWLSRWVGLTQFNWLEESRRRQLLAQVVPLYAKRGTKHYVERLLQFVIPETMRVVINDQSAHGFRIGAAHLGIDSWLDDDRPFWFQVRVLVSSGEKSRTAEELRAHWEPRIRQVVDLAKPAHTLYDVYWDFASP